MCPLGIPTLVPSQWPFKDTVCQCEGFIGITLAASINTLALMAVNRYFRVVEPAKYRRYYTKKKTKRFYSMSVPLPFFISWYKLVFYPSKLVCFLQIHSGALTAIFVTVNLGLPTCIIFHRYLRIFCNCSLPQQQLPNYCGFGLMTVSIKSSPVEQLT